MILHGNVHTHLLSPHTLCCAHVIVYNATILIKCMSNADLYFAIFGAACMFHIKDMPVS